MKVRNNFKTIIIFTFRVQTFFFIEICKQNLEI
jgi:hypothetical protein